MSNVELAVDTPEVADVESAEPENKAVSNAKDGTEGDDAEQPEGGEDAKQDGADDKTKLDKALKRQKRKTRRVMAELRELRARFKELETNRGTSTLKPPEEKDFTSYADLLRAETDYKISKQTQEAEQKAQVERLKGQEQQILAHRQHEISQQAAEASQEIPDFAQVVQQAMPVINQLPEDFTELVMDLDNPPLAIYALSMEGRLEEVAAMHPALAAAHLLQAQQRGEAFVEHMRGQKAAKVSKAPEPMRGAKGTGQSSKPLSSMSGDELLAWLKK